MGVIEFAIFLLGVVCGIALTVFGVFDGWKW
jgi:hypothetical protein